ncbi:MAG TPA: hypothetical protein VGU63_13485 [Candidatus Acidoferrales bacterium]|nr:hypothetical protein [Candidatus Acidoferrales bacterium]
MRSLYAMVLMAAMIGYRGAGGEVSKKAAVFWIPPQIETYTPVTAENIEQRAFKIVTVRNGKQGDQVLSLIQKSNQRPQSGRIRIKISTESEFYDFDSNGIGVSSRGEDVKIGIKKLKQALCE